MLTPSASFFLYLKRESLQRYHAETQQAVKAQQNQIVEPELIPVGVLSNRSSSSIGASVANGEAYNAIVSKIME